MQQSPVDSVDVDMKLRVVGKIWEKDELVGGRIRNGDGQLAFGLVDGERGFELIVHDNRQMIGHGVKRVGDDGGNRVIGRTDDGTVKTMAVLSESIVSFWQTANFSDAAIHKVRDKDKVEAVVHAACRKAAV